MAALLLVVSLSRSAALRAAPQDFTLTNPAGTFRLAQARGGYVALHFLLETECPHCLRYVQEYAGRTATLPGVVHLFLKPDRPAEIEAFAAKLPPAAGAAIYEDAGARLAEAYGVPGGYAFHGRTVRYPALILLGPDGKEVFRHVGRDNADRLPFDKLAAKVAELSRHPDLGQFNLSPGRPALGGYDPVAFHVAGRPEKGRAEHASAYRGATYRFSSRENQAKFAASPERYVPAYGGWCATAMAEGRKVEVDPANFKVTDGRLLLFYKGWLGNALNDWNKDEAGRMKKADAAWARIAPHDAPPKKERR
jgi:peroxiredoxin Q/BCP